MAEESFSAAIPLTQIPVDRDARSKNAIILFICFIFITKPPFNCRRMPDEVMQRLAYIPAGWRVEKTHVAVYRSKSGASKFIKGEPPAYLLRGSIVTPSLEAAIINAKYANAQPLRRIEKDFRQNGVCITEQNMASWTIKCAERYLSRFYPGQKNYRKYAANGAAEKRLLLLSGHSLFTIYCRTFGAWDPGRRKKQKTRPDQIYNVI